MKGTRDPVEWTNRPADTPRAGLAQLPKDPGLPKPQYDGGEMQYRVRGEDMSRFLDVYHSLLRLSWWRLLLLASGAYVGINLLFAVLYALDDAHVAGARAGSVVDHFWFSVQTFSTIGYGAMSPNTPWAHALVTVESFVGMVLVAMGTGFLFAKASRPTARVLFSEPMVVRTRNGIPSLMFRVANRRRNQVVQARIGLHALVSEVTAEGQWMRRVVDLPLERDTSPIFSLSFTAIHPLDEESPLCGLTPEELRERVAVFVVVFTGIDSTFSQQVHARKIYPPEAIRFGHRFVDVLNRDKDGGLRMDLDRMHDTRPVQDRL